MSPLIAKLRKLEEGDQVALTVDDVVLRGEVTYRHRRPAQLTDGVPTRGEVAVDIDLERDTAQTRDLPSENLEVTVTEKRPASWAEPDVELWDPVVDEDGLVQEDEFADIGDLEDVEVTA